MEEQFEDNEVVEEIRGTPLNQENVYSLQEKFDIKYTNEEDDLYIDQQIHYNS